MSITETVFFLFCTHNAEYVQKIFDFLRLPRVFAGATYSQRRILTSRASYDKMISC